MTHLIFHVDDYATGDGQTDDFHSIQQLLDIHPENGSLKLIFGHRKTYYLSNPLRLVFSRTHLDGNSCILNFECKDSQGGFDLQRVSDSTIENFYIATTGNKPPSALWIRYLEWKDWFFGLFRFVQFYTDPDEDDDEY